MSKRKPPSFSTAAFAAEPFVGFKEHDFMTARRERARCCETTETAAENADFVRGFHVNAEENFTTEGTENTEGSRCFAKCA